MSETIRFWFRRTYRLPPNDPRYLDLTDTEIEAEYWAYYFRDLAASGKTEEAYDEEFELDEVLRAMESDDWETVIND